MNTATGEVFRTDANGNTFWRLFRAGNERGRLFSLNANANFYLESPEGGLRFRTMGDTRMVILHDLPADSLNGFTGLDLSGFMGQGAEFESSTTGPRPFSWHHITQGAAPEGVYRPWLRVGSTYSQGTAMGYFGLRNAADAEHAVLAWGDEQEGSTGELRFTFVRDLADAGTAGTTDGLEAARVKPHASGNESYFGIGDFQTASAQPTQRLDILNGKVRIRQLPSDTTSTSNELVTVNMTTGVLEHRPAAALPDNCEWDMNLGTYDIYTAFGTSTTCPDESSKVTIGSNVPGNAKFTVVSDYALGSTYDVILAHATVASPTTGVLAAVKGIVDPGAGGQTGVLHMGMAGYATDASQTNYGVFGRAMGDPSGNNAGVNGEATGPENNIGVRGYGYAGSDSRGVEGTGAGSDCNGSAYGVHGKAVGAKYNYGVYGYADPEFCGSDTANRFYAGYFAGNVFGAGGLLTPSDEMLKQDIMELQGGLSVVMNLRPKTYSYRTQEFPRMGLPTGPQAGLLAQEMEEVLPGLVQQVHHPRSMDSTGQVVAEGVDFKGLKMEGVIPYLIQAIQEQQATIDHLSQRLDEQAQQLANCCEAGAGEVRSDAPAPAIHSSETDRQLRIQPNPFNERTVVSYELEQGGRMQLMANSADGKQLNVLEEAQREAGAYQYGWNTSGLAPGVYYVTLLLDGQPLVKKAVKVAR